MKKFVLKINFYALICIASINIGCGQNKMSEYIEDKSIGINGSFELEKNNIPVNWIIYSPKTVPSSDFSIILDKTHIKDGKQSLKFSVKKCVNTGGWLSPGLSKELEAKPNEIYKVSFWVKNNKSEFIAKIGGVSAMDGIYTTIIQSNEQVDDWKKIEYTYTIPNKMNAIRFELNITKPGDFWMDDFNITKIK